MTVQPVQSLSGVSSAARTGGSAAAGGSFERLLEQFVGQAKQAEALANEQVQQLALGQADSVHAVMLAVAQAEMAFRMVMEVRDRLVQAYNEVLRMQV